jgi:NAD(P)-dependent dehydrogenase (short-subunit alcohol dehydrogenase family)
LTKYLASYWGHLGVRVNSLSPGGIYNNQDTKFVRKISKLIPLNRMLQKEELKGSIQFLCSDASSYLNGHNLVLDGGRSII